MAGTTHAVCSTEELDDGDKLVVQLEGKEVAVFNIEGEFHAYLNWCPHQGGPCCEGKVSGTNVATYDRETMEVSLEWTKEDKIMNCPWHGWEFDLTNGECLSRRGSELPSFPVNVDDGQVHVTV
ncbi:Rieske (2Fe-2S) protein [Halobacteriales archaeon Cl-PHB]